MNKEITNKNKKIAVLYSWWSNYWWIYTFFRDIIKEIKKENKNIQIDIFSITELPPWNLFDNNFLVKTPKFIKNFVFKFNLHIIFSSLFLPFFFLKKLKTYDKVIINQELAFPLWKLLKNSVTIIHWTSIWPAKYWKNKKKYLYTAYYYFLHINCILTYKFSKKIYTVSEYTKNLVSNYNKNIKVCGWWVNLDFWKYQNNVSKENSWFNKNDFLMIFVWRFDIWKWKNELIDLMKNINNNDIKLICISRKPNNSKELEKYNIYFFENISEDKIKQLYSISDLFIFPTKYEWYGSVIAEALSIWLPIITTNVWLWDILEKKYIKIYKNNIHILNPLDNYKKYLEKVNYIKQNKIWKINYNIPEINIKKALQCWKNVFIK